MLVIVLGIGDIKVNSDWEKEKKKLTEFVFYLGERV